ncbi:hypothetical protein PoB_004215300 [Plakobranchus ocellatus]|uniref:Uncharacterized protein n=1 Tax=Plakobranchus ocellatus TaxID=259542 RepID=A0AAV4B920_9GAST|nr:hypothetical protein PoB_004215300 [Plakobranchus ocellatus]
MQIACFELTMPSMTAFPFHDHSSRIFSQIQSPPASSFSSPNLLSSMCVPFPPMDAYLKTYVCPLWRPSQELGPWPALLYLIHKVTRWISIRDRTLG